MLFIEFTTEDVQKVSYLITNCGKVYFHKGHVGRYFQLKNVYFGGCKDPDFFFIGRSRWIYISWTTKKGAPIGTPSGNQGWMTLERVFHTESAALTSKSAAAV